MRSSPRSVMLTSVPVTVTLLLTAAAGYLVGSLPIALTVARRHGIADLRDVGDHNPGYWNTMELLGPRAALPVLVGDAAKGAAATATGALLADPGQWWLPIVGAGAAMVGHAFPLFAGFRGGRSVLTFVGAATVYTPVAALGAIITMLIVWAVRRRGFDWAARAGVAAFPVCQFVIEGAVRTAATGVLMTFIGIRFAQAWRSGRLRQMR